MGNLEKLGFFAIAPSRMKDKKGKLTDKQRLFCYEVVGKKQSLADAYRAVYSTEGWSDNAIRVEASRTLALPNVSLMVDRLKGEYDKLRKAQVLSDSELALSKLRYFVENGTAEDGTKLRATEILARASGLFVDKIQTETISRDANEVAAELEDRLNRIIGAGRPSDPGADPEISTDHDPANENLH